MGIKSASSNGVLFAFWSLLIITAILAFVYPEQEDLHESQIEVFPRLTKRKSKNKKAKVEKKSCNNDKELCGEGQLPCCDDKNMYCGRDKGEPAYTCRKFKR